MGGVRLRGVRPASLPDPGAGGGGGKGAAADHYHHQPAAVPLHLRTLHAPLRVFYREQAAH
jgi:hypothetical protein